MDLDGLKRVNDEHGHAAGDQAIRDLAEVIRSELRATDIGARRGGDEFAILAPDTSHAAAQALAERIRASIPRQTRAWQVSGSVGVAVVEPDRSSREMDSATLMRVADTALYQAKRGGKDRIVTIATAAQDGRTAELGQGNGSDRHTHPRDDGMREHARWPPTAS